MENVAKKYTVALSSIWTVYFANSQIVKIR